MALPTEGSYFRQIGERARKLDQPAQEGITGSLQAGIGQAAQPLGASHIQAAGGQIQAQRGQAAVQAQQQAAPAVQAQMKLGQVAEQRQVEQGLFDRALELERTVRANEKSLANLDRTLANDIYTQNMQFQEDELGRAFLNDRQLADYALISAKSEEDWLNYEQSVTQMSKRRMMLLEAAQRKIQQALAQDWQLGEQGLDQAHKKELVESAARMKQKMAEETAKAKNRASMFSAGGMVIGAVVGVVAAPFTGGLINPATGAMLGAGMGQGLGSVAATL